MSLHIRLFGLLLLSCCVNTHSQEVTTELDSIIPVNRSAVHFDFGFVLAPQATGDNFFAKGYDLKSGADVGMTLQTKHITIHGNMVFHRAEIIDRGIVGNIDVSNVNRYSFGLGYDFKIGDKFTMNPSLNYGYILLRNKVAGASDFRDEGNFFSLDAQLNYKIADGFSVFISVTGYQDYFKINTPREIQDFFDSSFSIYPVVGMRLSILSRRTPGKPGNGIFTRRDGL